VVEVSVARPEAFLLWDVSEPDFTLVLRRASSPRVAPAATLRLSCMSLSRLWQRQGQGHAAHQLLAAVYAWFTEGFDTPDLQDAQTLLRQLSSTS
jgi:hypothetical protein